MFRKKNRNQTSITFYLKWITKLQKKNIDHLRSELEKKLRKELEGAYLGGDTADRGVTGLPLGQRSVFWPGGMTAPHGGMVAPHRAAMMYDRNRLAAIATSSSSRDASFVLRGTTPLAASRRTHGD